MDELCMEDIRKMSEVYRASANTSLDVFYSDLLISETERLFLAAVDVALFLVGTTGNIMVLLAVALSQRLQTLSNLFVVNLSITDLLTSLAVPFQVIALLSDDGWPLPDVICEMVATIMITTILCSIITVALIAINRCVLITNTRKMYQSIFSKKAMIVLVALSWMVPFFTSVLPQIIYQRLGYDPFFHLCMWDSIHPKAFLIFIPSATIGFLSFSVSLGSYILIYRHVKKSGILSNSGNLTTRSSSVHHRGKNRQKKVELVITKNMLYVICCFFLCVGPVVCQMLLLPLLEGEALIIGLHASTYGATIVLFDSCINPLIYALKHPHFKLIFSCMMRCRLKNIPEPSKCLAARLRIHVIPRRDVPSSITDEKKPCSSLKSI